MSAAEFRNYLKTKGRNDPRIVPVDMKQKYELFQNMWFIFFFSMI